MSLGLVSPLLNRGVRSRWLASLPGVGTTKMLTIDSNGDTAFQDVPVAAWGSITGTLSAQTDLQNALNAKLNLTGGTLTGGLSGTSATFSSFLLSSSKLNVTEYSSPYVVSIRASTAWSAEPLLTGYPWHFAWVDDIPKITIQCANAPLGIKISSDSFFAFTNSTNSRSGTVDLSLFRDAANTLGIRNSTNAQRFNLYGTYTDASNYRRLYVSSTTAGAFTLGVEGAGTGASGNTLTVANATTFSGTVNFIGGDWNTPSFYLGSSIRLYGPSALVTTILGEECSALDQSNFKFRMQIGLGWSSTNSANGSADVYLRRNSSGPSLQVRAAGGIQIRNANDSADAPITASTGTFNTSSSVVSLTINNTADNPTISLLSGVTVSNFTGVGIGPNVTTSTCGRWSQASSVANRGGIAFNGFTGTDSSVSPVTFVGYHGSISPTTGALSFTAWKHNGTTSRQNLASTEIIADFYNGSNLAARLLANSTLQLYNTFTDASNYIRQSLSFTTYSATVHAQIAAEGAGTGAVNVPFVITPRGTGAFILGPMPDGTATGGNARGARAVDLQTQRTTASQVASGANSFIASGSNNIASGSGAIAGGDYCEATNTNAIAIGSSNSATNSAAASFGLVNVSSGLGSITLGGYNTATEPTSIAVGSFSLANRPCQFSQSSGNFSTRGDGQFVRIVGGIKTTSNVAASIRLSAGVSSYGSGDWGSVNAKRITIPSGKLFLFTAKIVGVKSDGTSRACYIREGAIINIAGTTSLVGAITTIGADHEDNAATDVAITADDTNDALDISVTGITSETWRWVAVVEGVEVAYGT